LMKYGLHLGRSLKTAGRKHAKSFRSCEQQGLHNDPGSV
jgi:hypothetical protein